MLNVRTTDKTDWMTDKGDKMMDKTDRDDRNGTEILHIKTKILKTSFISK